MDYPGAVGVVVTPTMVEVWGVQELLGRVMQGELDVVVLMEMVEMDLMVAVVEQGVVDIVPGLHLVFLVATVGV
jgi:hypothetical protein